MKSFGAFNAKDLQGIFGSSNDSEEAANDFKPRVDHKQKVSRLRAGVAPKWAELDSLATEDSIVKSGAVIQSEVVQEVHFPDRSRASTSVSDVSPATIISTDRRLKLLSRAPALNVTGDIVGPPIDIAPQRRRIYEAEVVIEGSLNATQKTSTHFSQTTITSQENAAPEDAIMARRAQAKAKQQELERERLTDNPRGVIEQKRAESLPSPSGSDSSEYETDTSSEEEIESGQSVARPVFIPKAHREAIHAAEVAHNEILLQRERDRKKQQQQISRQMVAEGLRRAETSDCTADNDSDAGLPDDTDGVDPERERDEWELRELRRIQVDIDRSKAEAAEAAEFLRCSQRTDDEAESELKLSQEQVGDGCQSIQVQHKLKAGVFYVDDNSVKGIQDVRLRDVKGLTSTQATRQAAIKSLARDHAALVMGSVKSLGVPETDDLP